MAKCVEMKIPTTNYSYPEKEIIRDGFRSEEQATAYLKSMTKVFFKTHTYTCVARSDAYIHPTRR